MTTIKIGAVVRSVLAPKSDGVEGVVIYIERRERIDGARSEFYGVSWVGHDGKPGDAVSHYAAELVVVR